MADSLLGELKQMERSTEYDAEKLDIYTNWPDIRRTTELTQQYADQVEQAVKTAHQDISEKFKTELGRMAKQLAL